MKIFPILFFNLLLISVFFPSVVFAQSYQFDISGPDTVKNGENVTVVVSITDDNKNPVSGITPEITFGPGKNVSGEILFDCEDEKFLDNCQANHQGVPGIFEISFVLVDQPVNVEATVDGVRKGIRLGTMLSSSLAEYERKYAKPSAVKNVVPVVGPEDVQAGPWPSFWLLLSPFLLFLFVFLYVMKNTTE